jgi:two-component system sensor histidine kinase/response regulator
VPPRARQADGENHRREGVLTGLSEGWATTDAQGVRVGAKPAALGVRRQGTKRTKAICNPVPVSGLCRAGDDLGSRPHPHSRDELMTDDVPLPRPTILVVDDNDANRALARSTLEDEGYRVVLANDGRAAIVAFEREAPDCVLLDVRMPDIDGFEACARIRALPGGAETPVVFLTALRDVDTFDRALEAGGDDFLAKPVRPAELVARVQTALKLRRMRVELREHYELLKHQRNDLLRVQLQKERLTTFVVHDLKNPVNSMDLHAQLLLRDPQLSEKARESATQIRNEARQLSRMILNLLDLSKGDEGKLFARRAEVDLRSLVRDLLGELAAAAEARNVRLESSVDACEIHADADLLRRTLINLIENAMRHAPADSIVMVTATALADATEFRVIDAGPGVPSDLKEKIFDPFVQLDQVEGGGERHVTRGGRGLGLAFCKLAVEAHGGRIWVEDTAAGAVFCVRVPHDRRDS